MSGKGDLKVLVKSAEDLAYALRDTLDVLADHERRIKRLEEKLGFLANVESRVVEKAVAGGVLNEASAFS
ncbi:MAG: hypothetical protein QXQ94_10095 [Candidatus Bathyarchaeia archaeon]